MRKTIIFSFLVWLLMPHMLLAATADRDTLQRLGIAQSAMSTLLSSDTQGWKYGKIGNSLVRYTVQGDVVGYDENDHVWWRLVTPVSTELPITALAISVNSSGVATRQIVTLEAGKGVISQEKAKPQVQPVVPKQEVIATVPQKVVPAKEIVPPKPVEKTVQKVEQKIVEKSQKSSKTSKVAQQEKDAVIKVASTWDFMKEYQRQIGR
jgi:hypothetical protein